MVRKYHFLLTICASAALSATIASAQVTKPVVSGPVTSAQELALDGKEFGLEKRVLKASRPLQTVTVSVTCGGPVPALNSINAALARLNPNGVNVVQVSGNCNENVTVQSFENLTLTANPGASINDASGGTLDTLDIADSREVTVTGFTINGAVACFEYSLCRFNGNTVQGSPGDGVTVSRAEAAFQSDTIQNNAGRGISALNGSVVRVIGDLLTGNAAAGAMANLGSHLTLVNVTSVNNTGAGVRIASHSFLRLVDSVFTNNGLQGVNIDSSSGARSDTIATGNTITGNGLAGVRIGDLSFLQFFGSDNITGNNLANPGGLDVVCVPQFSATRGALSSIGGGTTNCVEP